MAEISPTETCTHELKNSDRLIHLDSVKGDELSDSTFLQETGIINPTDKFVGADTITDQFLRDKKDFGNGWFRGGGESIYKIVRIHYVHERKQRSKIVAYKALSSMSGNLTEMAKREAEWQFRAFSVGIAPRVYAVGSGTIIKEFLEEDHPEQKMSKEEHNKQLEDLRIKLAEIGLQATFRNRDGLPALDTVQHQEKLYIIDFGGGDMEQIVAQ